eukprot:TRINITY_DN18481_c0_g1_i1.p1 TRINITY_DN18481_c0_g1~~TRINITY_DN18481_c0_g1_i1.p1  ORF type:complete len:231 (+),score=21.91 TRINITY_DN18481_c0_g1_i1:324-1016(+)
MPFATDSMSMFAVIFGQVIGQARELDPAIMDRSAVALYWSSLWRCTYTLFLSITGGVSWVEVAQPLEDLGPAVLFGFLFYVALIQWVVLNVITGTFCESAAEAARKDVTLAVHAHRSDRDHFLQRLQAIFDSIDMNRSGKLEAHELQAYLDSEPAHALFATLDLDVMDVQGLIEVLDDHGDEKIDLEEFLLGCLRLRGSARAIDIAKLEHRARQMNQKLNTLLQNRGLKT